jgi:hypothetical protein
MALLTEENNQTHQVVVLNKEDESRARIEFYGSKGECEKFVLDYPEASDTTLMIEEIDSQDPRHY